MEARPWPAVAIPPCSSGQFPLEYLDIVKIMDKCGERSQSHRTHLVNSHGHRLHASTETHARVSVAIPPYSSGQFPQTRIGSHQPRRRKKVAIPPYLSGQFPLTISTSATSRPLAQSRNPTVLIWSIPTSFGTAWFAGAPLGGRVAIPPYSSSQFPLRPENRRATCPSSAASRNPTVLIWSIPTGWDFRIRSDRVFRVRSQSHRTRLVNFHARDQSCCGRSGSHCRNPTVLIWSIPTVPRVHRRPQPLIFRVAIPPYSIPTSIFSKISAPSRLSRNPPYSAGQFPRRSASCAIPASTSASRNPTVLIWSIPTTNDMPIVTIASFRATSQSHRTHLVNSDYGPSGDMGGLLLTSRNPTALIWSIPTVTPSARMTGPTPPPSRNPTVLIWSIPTVALVSHGFSRWLDPLPPLPLAGAFPGGLYTASKRAS
jgi:hypothetical protein